jgi:putative hydrolase
VSDVPFGFNRPNDPDDSGGGSGKGGSGGPGGDQPDNPFGFGDQQQFADMLRQFADMMSAPQSAGPVNWDLAKNLARHAVASEGDPSVNAVDKAAVGEAMRLADLWLDDVTTFPSGVRNVAAWSRSEWIENTLPVWSQLCDPIAARAVESMGSIVPEEMQAMTGPLIGMVKQMGGMMVGQQTGQAIGALAREVVGSTDVGLPLGPAGTAALLPRNVAAFGEGLGIPDDQVRLYLAIREAAHHRLFQHVPWLRQHLLTAVEDFARGITVDMSKLEESLGELDLSEPEKIQEALSGGALLQPEETPQQRAALARLETALALVEGWVATVTDAASAGRLPGADALAEAVRRRRATGGPAERTFATLVGLELRPRRLREAAALWEKLAEAREISGRDALWDHPDLLPGADDLDDPDAFVRGDGSDALDIDISELTGENGTDDDTGDGDGDDRPHPSS